LRKITVILLFSAALISGAFWVGRIWQPAPVAGPGLTSLAPLEPVRRLSVFRVPVVITRSAIRSALESQVPRSTTGRQEDPIPQFLTGAEIDWSVDRGPLELADRADALEISTELAGRMHIAGTVAGLTDDVVGTLGGLVNPTLGQGLEQLTGTLIDQYAGFRGLVSVTSRPQLTSNWRLEPNLSGRASVGQAALSIAGVPFEFRAQLQPLLDRRVSDQIADLQSSIRNNPILEQVARREWSKLCRSIPLAGVSPNLPKLWLELKPVHAFAEQPRIDAAGVVLDIGVQAETRILANETTPECPFPDQLEIAPLVKRDGINIAIPIELPLTDVSQLLETQLAGKTVPEDPTGPVSITIQHVGLAASDDRLVMSLRVKVRARESWFGLGIDADIDVSGRPALEPGQQLLRLTDIAVDVHSAAAFGLVGKAAEALEPMIRDTLAKKAVIDLQPFSVDAKDKIANAIADFSSPDTGIKLDNTVDDVRAVDIGFDTQTVRIVAEARGTINILVSSLTF
jgi:hypothetical protein